MGDTVALFVCYLCGDAPPTFNLNKHRGYWLCDSCHEDIHKNCLESGKAAKAIIAYLDDGGDIDSAVIYIYNGCRVFDYDLVSAAMKEIYKHEYADAWPAHKVMSLLNLELKEGAVHKKYSSGESRRLG